MNCPSSSAPPSVRLTPLAIHPVLLWRSRGGPVRSSYPRCSIHAFRILPAAAADGPILKPSTNLSWSVADPPSAAVDRLWMLNRASPLRALAEVAEELGHAAVVGRGQRGKGRGSLGGSTGVDLLRVDCEGCELDGLEYLLMDEYMGGDGEWRLGGLPVRQLLLDVHLFETSGGAEPEARGSLRRLMRGLAQAGFATFRKHCLHPLDSSSCAFCMLRIILPRGSHPSPDGALQEMKTSASLPFDAAHGLPRTMEDGLHAEKLRRHREWVGEQLLAGIRADPFFQFNWHPTWTCGTARRLGGKRHGDAGNYWICEPDRFAALRMGGCLVYSIGSGNDFRFEEEVMALNPGCEVHTFDPFVDEPLPPSFLSGFHPFGVGGRLGGPAGHSIESLANHLGHASRTIEVVKIDCEGCELSALPALAAAVEAGRMKVNQILAEVHLWPPKTEPPPEEAAHATLAALMAADFAVFHKEVNSRSPDGSCAELSLVHIGVSGGT